MMMNSQRIIMGIDPGTNILGFGVILVDKKKVHLVDMGVIDLRKAGDHFSKLNIIMSEVGDLIDKYKPDDFAVEAPFYGKNPQVMLKLGRAQGAALAAAFSRSVPVYEYAPRKVKIAITGNGAASKEQVAIMLEKTLQTKLETKFLDASDAVSIALCHFYQLTNPLSDLQTSTSWNDFLKAHPEKVK
jgi:crossover junction endodeoxyribonuclease RuvC